MIPTLDCPPVAYHLDEESSGYAEQQRAEEHDRHIKGDAAGVMHQAGIPREAAKALADQMHADARRLREQADKLSHTKDAEWELTPKRLRVIGDADGRLVERVVGE